MGVSIRLSLLKWFLNSKLVGTPFASTGYSSRVMVADIIKIENLLTFSDGWSNLSFLMNWWGLSFILRQQNSLYTKLFIFKTRYIHCGYYTALYYTADERPSRFKSRQEHHHWIVVTKMAPPFFSSRRHLVELFSSWPEEQGRKQTMIVWRSLRVKADDPKRIKADDPSESKGSFFQVRKSTKKRFPSHWSVSFTAISQLSSNVMLSTSPLVMWEIILECGIPRSYLIHLDSKMKIMLCEISEITSSLTLNDLVTLHIKPSTNA